MILPTVEVLINGRIMWLLNTVINLPWNVINIAVGTVQTAKTTLTTLLNINYYIISGLFTGIKWIFVSIWLVSKSTFGVIVCLCEEFLIFLSENVQMAATFVNNGKYFLDTYIPQLISQFYSWILNISENVFINFPVLVYTKIGAILSSLFYFFVLVLETITDYVILALISIPCTLQLIPMAIMAFLKSIFQYLTWIIVISYENVICFFLNFVLLIANFPFLIPLRVWVTLFICTSLAYAIPRLNIPGIPDTRVPIKMAIDFLKAIIRLVFDILLYLPRKVIRGIRADKDGDVQRDVMIIQHQYCVICVDDEKCVVLMPCRHLCLCEKCWREIKRRHERCPICRNPVNDGIHVFL